MSTVHQVMHLDELVESRPCHVNVDGTGVMLVKVFGTPHALLDSCPNDRTALSEGTVVAGVICCPERGCAFTLADGLPVADSTATPATVLPTRLTAKEWVEVELPGEQS